MDAIPDLTGDSVAVILARMEVKLDNALTEQQRHTTTLDRHGQLLDDHGNRLTSLETAAATAASQSRSWPAWTATAVSALTLGVLLLKDIYS